MKTLYTIAAMAFLINAAHAGVTNRPQTVCHSANDWARIFLLSKTDQTAAAELMLALKEEGVCFTMKAGVEYVVEKWSADLPCILPRGISFCVWAPGVDDKP